MGGSEVPSRIVPTLLVSSVELGSVWEREDQFEGQRQLDPWESFNSSCTHLCRFCSQTHPDFCPFLPVLRGLDHPNYQLSLCLPRRRGLGM